MKHRCEISEERPASDRAFMVCLSEAPEMPGPRWKGSTAWTVHACKPPYPDPKDDEPDGWSWINLNGPEKDCIGTELLKCLQATGETPWLWCVLYLEPEKNDG